MDRAGVRRLAADSNFRALWIGQLISIFGDRFHYLALLALIVERARDSGNPARELALVPIVSFVPGILFGPIAGPLVDRWGTRRVLIVSDAIRGCLVLLLIPAAVLGGLPPAFFLVFLLYVANSFFLPARSAILPELVPEAALVPANSLATLAGVLATLGGSVLGGLLVQRVGWRWGFGIDAATYFTSVAALAMIRIPARPEGAAAVALGPIYGGLRQSIAEGARIARRDRRVRGAIGALVLLWIAGGALHVAGTVLIRERTSGVVAGVGALLATVGLGMVAGTLLLSTAARRCSGGFLASLALLGIGGAVAAFPLARAGLPLHAVAFTAGVFVALLLVTTEATIQRAVVPEARGRVFALRDIATRVGVLGSAALTGVAVGNHWATSAGAVLAAGAVVAIAGVIGALLSMPRGSRGARKEVAA
jgi:predicted MFS family arabinose efflux permease